MSKRHDKVIAEMGRALDVADGIIAINCGIDTPKEWDRAMRKVAKARASLTPSAQTEMGEVSVRCTPQEVK